MKEKRNLLIGSVLIAAFALWTFLIQWVDVQAVGQNGMKIGFVVSSLCRNIYSDKTAVCRHHLFGYFGREGITD